MRAPSADRPSTAGPDSGPSSPFPLRLSGPVIKGFGRGSSELQIPTANIPISGLSVGGNSEVASGVYYGFASLDLPARAATTPAPHACENAIAADDSQLGNEGSLELHDGGKNVFPMVMSIGWNPFYKNEKRSVEVHIVHRFETDFYGVEMRLCILGYIRPEYDYVSKEALIEDIHKDIQVGVKSLEREAYRGFREDLYLAAFGSENGENTNGEAN